MNPEILMAEEASIVSFRCLVLTDLPVNTTVKWEHRSPNEKVVTQHSSLYTCGDLLQGSIESKELSVSGNRKAMEMTLLSVTQSQSGFYVCVADNGFQRVEKSVSLTVFPQGM